MVTGGLGASLVPLLGGGDFSHFSFAGVVAHPSSFANAGADTATAQATEERNTRVFVMASSFGRRRVVAPRSRRLAGPQAAVMPCSAGAPARGSPRRARTREHGERGARKELDRS